MLQFDRNWRFDSPGTADADFAEVILGSIILPISGDIPPQSIIEIFKRNFSRLSGNRPSRSSTLDWAISDLRRLLVDLAEKNTALFCEAIYESIEQLKNFEQVRVDVPDWDYINRYLVKCGMTIEPPNLILFDEYLPIRVEKPVTLSDTANALIDKHLNESENHLARGDNVAAVSAIFWLLETISTSFKGAVVSDDGQVITGNYFSQIMKDLKNANKGKTLEMIIKWIENLYGYLSSPTGGGVRHGGDISSNTVISNSEAKLFCDLARSYISYMLAEYDRIKQK